MKTGIPTENIDKIYKRYGYDILDRRPGASIYILQQGMYPGAEIVITSENAEDEKLKKEFSEAGYACKVRRFYEEEEIEECLFKGFFNKDLLSKRAKNKYIDFVNKQTRNLEKGALYQYIKSPFTLYNDDLINEYESIIDIINEVLPKKGAFFIIIEAAAGFGKTCTAYEILNSINQSYSSHTPLFTELANDRQAKIFKYVLLSAIDAEYRQSVHSDLVKHHIKSGRIPLIIDGFDELLSKEQDTGKTKSTDFEEVETMLSTIAELLQENSKIILTSRKTAIFAGEQFTEWSDTYKNKFTTIRITIEKPQLKHWLNENQIETINNNKIPLKHIANPVLLSYLRHLEKQAFEDIVKSADSIVEKYFHNLLDRERERQNLLLSPEIQLKIFQSLASEFAYFNITAEEKSFVKDLIITDNIDILQKCSNMYPSSERPTIDELAEKLANHALMDRAGSKKDIIGFINEFVLGTFLGKVVIEKFISSDKMDIHENMLDIIIQAYQYNGQNTRLDLWNALNTIKVNPSFKILVDSKLRDQIYGVYEGQFFESLFFENVTFNDESIIYNCYFADCKFETCDFDFTNFRGVIFQGCIFINCTINSSVAEIHEIKEQISIFNCSDYDSGFLKSIDFKNIAEKNPQEHHENLEYLILRMFYQVGSRKRQMRTVTKIKSEILGDSPEPSQERELEKEMERLVDREYMIIEGNKSFISGIGSSYYFNKYFTQNN